MKIFISWSGDLSREVATKLYTWLRSVIHETRPWMSGESIAPGEVWFGELSDNITEARYGVICVTRENCGKRWLLWEAGALYRGFHGGSKGDAVKGKAHVVPFLVDMSKEELDQPLSHFQVIDGRDRKDVLALVRSINDELPAEDRLPDSIVETTFGHYWDDLQEAITKALEDHPSMVESTCPHTFEQAAEKFLSASTHEKQEASTKRDKIALRSALLYVGKLPLDKVTAESPQLQEYIQHRRAGTNLVPEGVKPPTPASDTTLNKDIRTINAVLNRAVKWGWIEYSRSIPQVKVVRKKRPYLLSSEKQRRVFQELPKNARAAALFAVNTGARRGLVADLEWSWLTKVSETDCPIFVIPPGYHRSARGKVLFLNSIAQWVIERQAGLHSRYVFPSKRGGQLNALGKIWQTAWKKAGLPSSGGYSRGLENLRLTFEQRLKDSGVAKEDRDLLLWTSEALKAQGDKPLDYAHLQDQVEKITEHQDIEILNL